MYKSRYVLCSFTFLLSIVLGVSALLQFNKPVNAKYRISIEESNQPIGNGVGVNPGRVVWIHEPDAVNEKMRNRNGDFWSNDKNTKPDISSHHH